MSELESKQHGACRLPRRGRAVGATIRRGRGRPVPPGGLVEGADGRGQGSGYFILRPPGPPSDRVRLFLALAAVGGLSRLSGRSRSCRPRAAARARHPRSGYPTRRCARTSLPSVVTWKLTCGISTRGWPARNPPATSSSGSEFNPADKGVLLEVQRQPVGPRGRRDRAGAAIRPLVVIEAGRSFSTLESRYRSRRPARARNRVGLAGRMLDALRVQHQNGGHGLAGVVTQAATSYESHRQRPKGAAQGTASFLPNRATGVRGHP